MVPTFSITSPMTQTNRYSVKQASVNRCTTFSSIAIVLGVRYHDTVDTYFNLFPGHTLYGWSAESTESAQTTWAWLIKGTWSNILLYFTCCMGVLHWSWSMCSPALWCIFILWASCLFHLFTVATLPHSGLDRWRSQAPEVNINSSIPHAVSSCLPLFCLFVVCGLGSSEQGHSDMAFHEVTWCIVVWCTQNLHWDSCSFMWHQPCQRCKYTTSMDI